MKSVLFVTLSSTVQKNLILDLVLGFLQTSSFLISETCCYKGNHYGFSIMEGPQINGSTWRIHLEDLEAVAGCFRIVSHSSNGIGCAARII